MEWYPGKRARDLVREKELHGLSLFDGCACGYFCVFSIDVDFCCHRTSREGVDGPVVAVDARSADITLECLHVVGKEVARQIQETFGYDEVSVIVREDGGDWNMIE